MDNGKLLVIFSSFGPRHRAKADVLHRYDPGAVFLEIAGYSNTYLWETSSEDLHFKLIRLFPLKKIDELSQIEIIPKLTKTLNNLNPNIIMYHGLLEPGFQSIAIWSKLKRVHGILHFDSWYDNNIRTPWKQFLKGILYKWFYKYAFVAGKYSKEYLISMGYPEKNIFVGCNVVDNNYFRGKSLFFKNNKYYREQEGLPEKYFLVVARYSPEKDHRTLIKAYKKYLDQGFNWKLVLIGDGPLREYINNFIKDLKLTDHIIQKGWINYTTIPIYYAYASCLILPSLSETWGLVANEAAACGLPMILSNKCGCVPELCISDRNGFVFDAGNAENLSESMMKMSNGSVDLSAFSEKSKELVSTFSLESWALTVLEIKKLLLS